MGVGTARMRTRIAATAALCAGMLAALVSAPAPVAQAAPADFPDIDRYVPAPLDLYFVTAAHPSGAGWRFTTPNGLECAASLIADLGVSCTGPIPDVGSGANRVSARFDQPGTFSTMDGAEPDRSRLLLPVGLKIATTSGIVCAVPSVEVLACRARKPDSWPDTAPEGSPSREYGEHGFVVKPGGSWAF